MSVVYNLRSRSRRTKKALSLGSEEETEKEETATPSKCMKVSDSLTLDSSSVPNQGVSTKANEMKGLGRRKEEGKAESEAVIHDIIASYNSEENKVGLGRSEEGEMESDVSSISSEDEPRSKIRKITAPYVHNGIEIGIESQDIFTMEPRTLSEEVWLDQVEAESIPNQNDDSSYGDTIVTPTKAKPVPVEQLKPSEEEELESNVSSISSENEPRSKLTTPYTRNGVEIGIESQDIFTMEHRTLSEEAWLDQVELGDTLVKHTGYLTEAKPVPIEQLKAIQQICPSSIRPGKLNYVYTTLSYKDFSMDSSTGSALTACERPVRCYKLSKNTFQTHAIKAGSAFNRMIFENAENMDSSEEEESSGESELSFTSYVEGMDTGLITDELGNIGIGQSREEGSSGAGGMGTGDGDMGMGQSEGPSRAGRIGIEGSHQTKEDYTRQDNVVEFDKGMDEVDEMLSRKAVRNNTSANINGCARKEILSKRTNNPSSNDGTEISRSKQSTNGTVGWRALIRTRAIPTSPTGMNSRRFGSESSSLSTVGAKLTQLARIKMREHANRKRVTTPTNDGTISRRTNSLETANPNQNQDSLERDASSEFATGELNETRRANQEINKRLPTTVSTQSKTTSASTTDTHFEVSRKLYYPVSLVKALHSFQSKDPPYGCSVVPALPQRCATISQDNMEDDKESPKPQDCSTQDHSTSPIRTANSSCSERIATPTNEITSTNETIPNEQSQLRPISLETIMTNDYTLPGDISNIVNKYWLFRVNS